MTVSHVLAEALDYLLTSIAQGYEYPDAEWRTLCNFKVKQEDLQAAYDDWCVKKF